MNANNLERLELSVAEIFAGALDGRFETRIYGGRVEVLVTDAADLEHATEVAASLTRCGWPCGAIYCD